MSDIAVTLTVETLRVCVNYILEHIHILQKGEQYAEKRLLKAIRKSKLKKETKSCIQKCHNSYGSSYPKDKVPLDKFKKEGSNIYLKTCFECRQYQYKIVKRYKNKISRLVEGSKNKYNGEYLGCASSVHTSKSDHPRDKVPVDLFRVEPGNKNSTLLKNCSDCRKNIAKRNINRTHKKKDKAKEEGKFYCTQCHKTLDEDQRAPNLDGTDSIHCLICKEGEKKRGKDIRNHYKDIKYQNMLKLQSSCGRCNLIYIYEDETLVKLETKEREKGRIVYYKEKRYYVKDFLVEFKHLLELDITQMDHLTEAEQREIGLLQEDDIFIPKKKIVSKLSSRKAMELEALKCQLLCGYCHLIETIERESKTPDPNTKSYHERDKLKYLKKIKDKGCVLCGYINTDLPRFYHFDHLDVSVKVKEIARMTKDKNYSMQDVIDEVAKCRVLCLHCHIIHTRNQRKEGIVSNKPLSSIRRKS